MISTTSVTTSRASQIEAQHYVPIFDKKRVIAVRAAVNHYQPDNGSTVPFYYILPLGGKDSIRGFADFRFRDLNAVLLNADIPLGGVVGRRHGRLLRCRHRCPAVEPTGIGRLKQSWGIGLRFNTYKSVFMRTEAAFGSGEGTRLYVTFGGPLRLQRYLR